MTAFILRRSLQSLVVLFVMSLLVFGGVNMVGDPVDMLINPGLINISTGSPTMFTPPNTSSDITKSTTRLCNDLRRMKAVIYNALEENPHTATSLTPLCEGVE